MSVKITVKDHGWRRLMRLAEELRQEPHVRVGVLAEKGSESRDGGVTNVELAAIHEFGAPAAGIPERSFLRSAFDANKTKYQGRIKSHLKQVIGGSMDLHKMFDLIGLEAATDVKKGITAGAGIPPPLKQATIDRKGSSRPLVDTGRLLASITHVVETGGGGHGEGGHGEGGHGHGGVH